VDLGAKNVAGNQLKQKAGNQDKTVNVCFHKICFSGIFNLNFLLYQLNPKMCKSCLSIFEVKN